MSFIGQIGVRLSGDNSDFKASMEDAGLAAEKFDKQVKKFGLGFGGVAAIATAFRAIVDYARDLENPMDENLKRAKAFAENLEGVKGKMLEIGAKALGVVNHIGEWYGRLLAVGELGEAQVALSEKTAEAAATQVRQLEESRRINKGIEEIHKAIAEQQDKNLDASNKQLDLETQILLNLSRKQAIRDQLNKDDITAIERAKLKLELEQAEGKALELAAQVKKVADEKAKKAAEEAEKAQEHELDLLDKRNKLIVEGMSPDKAVAYYSELMRQIQKEIAIRKENQLPTLSYEVELLEVKKDLGKAQISLAESEAKSQEKVLDVLEEQVRVRQQSVGLANAESNQDQSTEILREKAANLRAQLSDIEAQDFSAGASVGGRIRNPFRGIVTANLQATERELGLRSEVSANVARYGEQGARRFFGGSMAEFERILKAITPADSSDRTATGIDEINKRLENSGLFPKF
jgi:hypothetical protein